MPRGGGSSGIAESRRDRRLEAARKRAQTRTGNVEDMTRAYDAFRLIDTRGTGTIKTGELQHLFTTMGFTLSDEHAQQLISTFDADDSGAIEFKEFIDIMASGEAARNAISHNNPFALVSFGTMMRGFRRRQMLEDLLSGDEARQQALYHRTLGDDSRPDEGLRSYSEAHARYLMADFGENTRLSTQRYRRLEARDIGASVSNFGIPTTRRELQRQLVAPAVPLHAHEPMPPVVSLNLTPLPPRARRSAQSGRGRGASPGASTAAGGGGDGMSTAPAAAGGGSSVSAAAEGARPMRSGVAGHASMVPAAPSPPAPPFVAPSKESRGRAPRGPPLALASPARRGGSGGWSGGGSGGGGRPLGTGTFAGPRVPPSPLAGASTAGPRVPPSPPAGASGTGRARTSGGSPRHSVSFWGQLTQASALSGGADGGGGTDPTSPIRRPGVHPATQWVAGTRRAAPAAARPATSALGARGGVASEPGFVPPRRLSSSQLVLMHRSRSSSRPISPQLLHLIAQAHNESKGALPRSKISPPRRRSPGPKDDTAAARFGDASAKAEAGGGETQHDYEGISFDGRDWNPSPWLPPRAQPPRPAM